MNDTSELSLLSTRDDLLIASLRHANNVSGLLNDLSTEVMRLTEGDDDRRFDKLHDMLRTRFGENSGLPLFVAANNMHIDLPADLTGDDAS